jgi:hypothetical protein
MSQTIEKAATPSYVCIRCHYKCSNKYDYNKHINTKKHSNRTKNNELDQNVDNLLNETLLSSQFHCKYCKKTYSVRNSLWYHEQKCVLKPIISDTNIILDNSKNEINILTKLVLELVKSNNELKTQILDFNKNKTTLEID